MKRTNCKWIAAVCAACALFAVSASAAKTKVLTFDNVTTNFDDAIPNGYGGLIWVNFGAVDGTDYTSSGYQNGVVSADFVAHPIGTTNDTLTAVIKARPGHFFNLNSGYFTAAWNDNLQLDVIGKQNSFQVYHKTYVLSPTEPTFITFPKAAVTSVKFISSGGTQNTNLITGTGEHFAVDNLSVTVH